VTFFDVTSTSCAQAQDTDALQRAIIRRSLGPGGRLVAVGDPGQAIYGFRGAGTDSMALIEREFETIELPLTVSFRCARAVVYAAQQYNGLIEAAPDAVMGTVVKRETPDGLLDEQLVRQLVRQRDGCSLSARRPPETAGQGAVPELQPSDAILCRANAPLISQAYKLIAEGIGCRILGRDIGSQLAALVKKSATTDLPGLLSTLRRDLEALRELEAAEENGSTAADALQDRIECIRVVAFNLPDERRSLTGLLEALRELFADKRGALVTLSSIHKAKGLEWARVFVI
jgi:DNA helicase II / ATP-dependent DNA helicase PcrA